MQPEMQGGEDLSNTASSSLNCNNYSKVTIVLNQELVARQSVVPGFVQTNIHDNYTSCAVSDISVRLRDCVCNHHDG